MTVFSRRLRAGVIDAVYIPVSRKSPLGTVTDPPEPIKVIIDEGGSEDWQKTEAQHKSSVLIYCFPECPITRECVGGWIDICNGRKFRIDGYDVSKNQRTGIVEHIELTCSEQI